eukprot:3120485-Rhodomonas_salina.5
MAMGLQAKQWSMAEQCTAMEAITESRSLSLMMPRCPGPRVRANFGFWRPSLGLAHSELNPDDEHALSESQDAILSASEGYALWHWQVVESRPGGLLQPSQHPNLPERTQGHHLQRTAVSRKFHVDTPGHCRVF